MQTTTGMSDALGRYLDLTSRQMQLTASNMANVDTPGYKAQGFDFEQEFARQLNDRGGASGLEGAQVAALSTDDLRDLLASSRRSQSLSQLRQSSPIARNSSARSRCRT